MTGPRLNDPTLDVIVKTIQSWLDWNESSRASEGLKTEDGTAIMSLPVPMWPPRRALKAWIESIRDADARLALSAQPVQPVALPRLTEAMMRAACKAHYGTDNIDGTALTAFDYDWSFRDAFKRMWKGVRSAMPATPPASAGPVAVRATHRHKKRGKEYVLIGFGKMQAEYWTDTVPTWEAEPSTSVDMREVAIYRSVYDGSLWARPREEFEDGRFEALTQQAPEKP